VLNARAQRIQDATGQRPTTWWINLAMFVLPVLALSWYYGLHLRPELKGFNFVGGINAGQLASWCCGWR
jgi:general L-amino acid transport system permease protein